MLDLLPRVKRRDLAYADYRLDAQDCDLLLWEPTSWYGRVIAAATAGPFSHVSAGLWWASRLMSVGYEEGRGGVVEPLSNLVDRYPQTISVFRVKAAFDRIALKDRMLRDLGGPYRWENIRLIALLHLPVVRFLSQHPRLRRRVERASHNTMGGICSQYIARSFADAGVYFLRKHVSITTPNDLGKSAAVEYLGTLS